MSIDIDTTTATNINRRCLVLGAFGRTRGVEVAGRGSVLASWLCRLLRWYWSRNEDPSIVSWRRRAARQGATAAERNTSRRRGLDSATLKSLPLVVYDPKEFKDGLECSVCLSEIVEREKVRLLPKCNHGFHVECIDMWFKCHSTCPLCRNSVVSSDQNQSANPNQEVQQVGDTRNLSDSDSDSSSDSDSDHDEDGSRASVASPGEALNFPTNVLYWGNEVQVRSLGEAANSVDTSTSTLTSSSSNDVSVGTQRDELVIEIPSDLCNDCASSPAFRAGFSEGEPKTPVVSRLTSFKRLLSRGKSIAPWASGSSSANVEQV